MGRGLPRQPMVCRGKVTEGRGDVVGNRGNVMECLGETTGFQELQWQARGPIGCRGKVTEGRGNVMERSWRVVATSYVAVATSWVATATTNGAEQGHGLSWHCRDTPRQPTVRFATATHGLPWQAIGCRVNPWVAVARSRRVVARSRRVVATSWKGHGVSWQRHG